MGLKIRLARGGTKKRPFYRIVIADVRSPRDGRFVEKVGTYNPLLNKDNENRVTLVEDRIKHWLGHGAVPTDRVARFLGAAGLIAVPEQRNNPEKAKPKAKAVERQREQEEAKVAKAEAAVTAAEEAKQAAADAKQAEADAAVAAKEAAKAAAEAPAEEAVAEEAPAEEAAAEEEKPAS